MTTHHHYSIVIVVTIAAISINIVYLNCTRRLQGFRFGVKQKPHSEIPILTAAEAEQVASNVCDTDSLSVVRTSQWKDEFRIRS